MTAQRSMKPATEPPVNELQEADQHAEQINFQASHFSRGSQAHPYRSGPTPVWSAEVPINQREFLRAELRQNRTHAVLDLRRWFIPPNDNTRPTERGFAIAVRHLPAVAGLIEAALTQASATGLLSELHARHRRDGDVDGAAS
jgi:hypothetical protein